MHTRRSPLLLLDWARGLALAALMVALPWNGQAQTLTAATSPELACMTPPQASRGAPEYPAEQWERRDRETVDVDLVFTAPDQPPAVRPLGNTYKDAFFDAVRRHVQSFRVPCMAAGAPPVHLPFQYVFVPNDGRKVSWASQDSGQERQTRQRYQKCLQMPAAAMIGFPRREAMRDQQGVVMARLHFAAPDAPPALAWRHDGGSEGFEKAVMPFVQQVRLPCLESGTTWDADLEFVFVLDNGRRARLKDLDLATFLGYAKGLDAEKVFFDFNAMRCPFTVRFGLRQPYAGNRVGQVGEPVSARTPFLQWLSRLDLNLDDKTRELVMLQDSDIQVPCGALDL